MNDQIKTFVEKCDLQVYGHETADVQLESGNILRRNRQDLRKDRDTVVENTMTRLPAEGDRDRVTGSNPN